VVQDGFMKLYEGEREFTQHELGDLEGLIETIKNIRIEGLMVVGIDGRSGGGKSTLAKALSKRLGCSVLSTDDFAWWHSLFDWPEMLIENAIKPLRRNETLDYRPESWVERNREGSISAQPGNYLIVEGVGATQESMRKALDFKVWVQTDANVAKARGLERDRSQRPDPAEAERFWNEWQKAENVFQAQQQSWVHANYRVSGF
jgi:uridine kinase